MVETELPEQGVVFWPVGTGDSTTLVLGDDLVVQVDLRDMAAADEKGAVVAAVIDRLEDTLPQPDWLTEPPTWRCSPSPTPTWTTAAGSVTCWTAPS